jgi:large conductance mechanosensitive channel
MWSDFKKFLLRGNVIDLAVAVVMGAAFGAIVNSLVNDIVMPVIGFLTAGVDFSSFKIVLQQAVEATKTPQVAITYGHLIQVILQFLIIALTIFLVIRGIGKLRRKQEAKPAEPAPKPDDVVLLEEIRDLLKK